ncbi:two-component sensor histidine kinase [Sporolactobacillus sp. THM7-7]|nr:two-component sensor histidine kinase [Sporolactobacillus sp. THM7-7]
MRRMKILCFILSVFLILSFFWSVCYYLIGLTARYFGKTPDPLLQHIASSVLGMLVFMLLSMIFSHFHQPKRITYFQAVTQAIRQMAKGNFEIRMDISIPVPGPRSKNNPFVQLVDSVHYMAKELGHLERLRQEFISNVSHEIQSPLTSIKGFARALENENLPKEKRDHYLHIIQTESDRLSKLSDNLLKLTALENNRQSMTKTTYRLDGQIRHVLLPFEPMWRGKKIRMDIELAPVTVSADYDLMNQVWTNLIHNSIKFTSEAGTITVSLKQAQNRVVFSIADSGIGIREEDRIHLFERFYKADRSRNREAGGNGLGLSIVKKILDMHQWRIFVASEYGKGTTVTITVDEAAG